jgi:uracil-DNA glycosylase
MSPREGSSAAEFLPDGRSLEELRDAAAACRGCHLHAPATQTVFGEGLTRARIMLVGEQPGDKEDLQGHPFVGPAGRLLDDALGAAGIERSDAYVTNVVKHFKFELRGKRRIHKKPNLSEIRACTPWLEAELAAVRPKALVCLGATAAQALIGPSFKVSRQRGELVESAWAPVVTATVHPSSILRAATKWPAPQAFEELVSDLARVGQEVTG